MKVNGLALLLLEVWNTDFYFNLKLFSITLSIKKATGKIVIDSAKKRYAATVNIS